MAKNAILFNLKSIAFFYNLSAGSLFSYCSRLFLKRQAFNPENYAEAIPKF